MAKVIQPLGSIEARGAVGGLVYNTWRGISTVRTKVTPATKPPGRREAIQALTLTAARRWKTLTDAQRASWDDYANTHPDIDWTGNPKRIAGYHWYVRCIVTQLRLYTQYRDDPPPAPIAGSAIALALTGSLLEIHITWAYRPWELSFTQFVDVWLAGPHSAGRQMKIEDSKYLGGEGAEAEEHFDFVALPGLYSAHLRLLTNTGLIGPWSKVTGTVTD